MYILMCLSLAGVLALYIVLMKKLRQRRKHALKHAERQLAWLERKKRDELSKLDSPERVSKRQ